MRNLKKILALVLALVMSLSLMATASAADTTAAATENEVAVGVLKGLDIVKGDKDTGALRLDQPITRAEVAALMYRISTADVEDKEFTRYNGEFFKDVKDIDWYSGYVNYCWIAQIVNGDPAGYFAPNDNIDGYATLAMILRALGYGKNNEFKGDGWEIRTASKAKELGILDGIGDTQLRGAINRSLVFEILFRALRQDEVKFNQQYPNNYESVGTTLGQRMFGLEEVTGVIKANQWANLDGASVLAADTTKMTVTSTKPADTALYGKDITLSVATTLDSVGMSYNAYMADPDKDGVKTVLTDLADAKTNTVASNDGAPYTSEKLAATKSLSFNADTEYYLNYAENWYSDATSKWQVRYAIAKDSVKDNETWAAFIAKVDAKEVDGHTLTERDLPVNWDINEDKVIDAKDVIPCWVVSIRIGKTITEEDLAIMYAIFDTADKVGDTLDKTPILPDDTNAIGEVYVGTSSLEDQSDIKSWEEFDETYLNHKDVNKYDAVERGNSLRVIDNNNDGVAEYVLKIAYTQTKAVDTHKGELAFLGGVKMADWTGNNLHNPDGLTADDMGVVANYTIIDKKLYIYEAETLTDEIKAKNYRNVTVTTKDGDETLNQSDIVNDTGLEDEIMNLPEKTLYNLYLDEFRNIRSFEKVGSKQYALLTEVYDEGNYNWNYVNTNKVTVEAVLAEDEVAEDNTVEVKEYPESSAGVFFSNYEKQENAWTSRVDRYNRNDRLNFLQPATAHLGVEDNVYAGHTWPNTTARYTNNIWERDVFNAISDIDFDNDGSRDNVSPDVTDIAVFNYGNKTITNVAGDDYTNTTAGTSNGSFSFTNVALYENEDGKLTLSTASEVYHDQKNNRVYRATKDLTFGSETVERYETRTEAEWKTLYGTTTAFNTAVANYEIYLVYATDYVQLDTKNGRLMAEGGRHFNIDTLYNTKYQALSNTYVDTLNETVFYVVTPDDVYRTTGFNGFTTLLGKLNVDNINTASVRAAYAVAQNTREDANGQDYWVADVVVIELDEIGTPGYDSIALMYNNPSEYSNNTQDVESLEAEWRALQPEYDGEAQMMIYPKSTRWQNQSWTNDEYGFYAVYGQNLVAEGELSADEIARVYYGYYNYNGIFAGVIRRNKEIPNSGYIDVELAGKTYTPAGGTNRFDVKYTTDDVTWDVPIYRITTDGTESSVENLYLTNYEPTNTVEDGDRVIVVQNTAGQTAFIVDLGPNDTSVVGIKKTDYDIPAWLDQQWWMIAIEQTFTQGAKNATASASVAALNAAVDALYAAIKADDTGYTSYLLTTLLKEGKGYDPYVVKTLSDITGVNVDDLVAGLIGASNTLGGTWLEDVETRIDRAPLIKAIIAARAEIKAIKDKAIADGNGLTEDLADAALAALAGLSYASTTDDVKAIVDNLKTDIETENAARAEAVKDAAAVVEEYKAVVDTLENDADKAAAAAALATLNAVLNNSHSTAEQINAAVDAYVDAITEIAGAAVAAALRAAAVERAEDAITANADAISKIPNAEKKAAAEAATVALRAVIDDATKTAADINAALEVYEAAIAAALEPDPTPGVEIPAELEDSIEETPMTPAQMSGLDFEEVDTTNTIDDVIDTDTQELGEVVSASTLTIDPDAFTGKTLRLPYVTEAGEVPVVKMTDAAMTAAGISKIAVKPDTTAKAVAYTNWIIEITLLNANNQPAAAVDVVVATVEVIDKPVADVTITAATLNDTTGTVTGDLAKNYTAVLTGDTITISATDLKAHTNAAANGNPASSGNWIGFYVVLNSVTQEVDGENVTWAKVKYSKNGAAVQTQDGLDTLDTTEGSGKGFYVYYDYTDALKTSTNTFSISFTNAAGTVESSTVTYTVRFNVTLAE